MKDKTHKKIQRCELNAARLDRAVKLTKPYHLPWKSLTRQMAVAAEAYDESGNEISASPDKKWPLLVEFICKDSPWCADAAVKGLVSSGKPYPGFASVVIKTFAIPLKSTLAAELQHAEQFALGNNGKRPPEDELRERELKELGFKGPTVAERRLGLANDIIQHRGSDWMRQDSAGHFGAVMRLARHVRDHVPGEDDGKGHGR